MFIISVSFMKILQNYTPCYGYAHIVIVSKVLYEQ